jgi:adenine-specific DNA methylase
MTTWGSLFSRRQQLALLTLIHLVQQATRNVGQEQQDLGVAVQSVLALAVDRVAAQNSSLSWWQPSGEFCVGAFGRQALPMVWDFCEIQPLAGFSGGFEGALNWVVRVIEHMADSQLLVGSVSMSSATRHPLPDDSAEAVITDPPYYAAIPYADLSDFFYSWLKQSVGQVFPEWFSPALSPKEDELVQLSHRAAMYRNKDAAWFERMMGTACLDARRITKHSGIGLFVFANKETAGWEAMLAALISAGWTISASWPIDTERNVRMRARNSAVLGSSVHLVCRPRRTTSNGRAVTLTGDWRDVLTELPCRIHEWMPRLASEGVVGADSIFACLGPA